MRNTRWPALVAVLVLPAGPALADGWVRDILSSGATTASTYLTVKDDKRIVAARDDASSFVASGGQVRGPYLEAWLRQARAAQPERHASDLELATELLIAH